MHWLTGVTILLFVIVTMAYGADTFKTGPIPKGYENRANYGLIKGFPTGPVSKKYLQAAEIFPKAFDLSQIAELAPVKDQGSCGSCVYFAVSATFEDTYRVHGVVLPKLSPQWLMSCAAREWMCNGSFFSKVAAGLVAKGGQVQESDYPYTASSSSCKSGQYKLYGEATGQRIIDNSPKSIIAALNNKHAVAVTIGAGGSWMNYKSGIFNACSNIGTNHQVEVVGYDCETAVDSDGNCKFDSSGKLPKGVGWWRIKNSWGTGYGEAGYVKMKMTSSSGALCNNVAEEAGIIEIGEVPDLEPVSFVIQSKGVDLNATWNPAARYSVEEAKKALQRAADSLEEK